MRLLDRLLHPVLRPGHLHLAVFIQGQTRVARVIREALERRILLKAKDAIGLCPRQKDRPVSRVREGREKFFDPRLLIAACALQSILDRPQRDPAAIATLESVIDEPTQLRSDAMLN